MAARKKQVNINLIIKTDTNNSLSDQFLSWILTYGRYIIITTQIVVLSVFFFRFKIDRDHTDLKELVTQKQAVLESINDVEAEIRRVQGRLVNIRAISASQDSLLKVIRFLQQRTPADTVFSNLELTNDKISFQATSGNLRSFSFMLKQFQQDKKFSQVNLSDMTRKADGRIDFKIDAKINLQEFI